MEINVITFVVTDMAASVDFYTNLGGEIVYGGADAPFTALSFGSNFVNLQQTGEAPGLRWGRVIFHVDDVDALHERALAAGLSPRHPPRDADWGERMFAITDPSGHDLSFARPL